MDTKNREEKENLVACTIFVNTWNPQNNSSFGTPRPGNNPPDCVSTNNNGKEMLMEVTEFNALQAADIGKNSFIAREVNPVRTLIETLKKKSDKYEPAFCSTLILLLKGDIVSDDEFEDYEKQGDFELSFNKQALAQLGFKGIWYVSPVKKKAFKVF